MNYIEIYNNKLISEREVKIFLFQREKEENLRKSFNLIGSNVHHLISTKNIPGIYNPPHLPHLLKPILFNSDIDTNLKMIFKNKFKKTHKFELRCSYNLERFNEKSLPKINVCKSMQVKNSDFKKLKKI